MCIYQCYIMHACVPLLTFIIKLINILVIDFNTLNKLMYTISDVVNYIYFIIHNVISEYV